MTNKKIFVVTVLFLVTFMALSRPCLSQDFRSLFQKGVEDYSRGNYPEAIKNLQAAIEINQNFAQAYNYLGMSHIQNNSPLEETVWCFQQAADIDPKFAEAHSNMCRAYYQNEKHDEAEAACLKALEIDPNHLSAKMSLAWVYLLGKPQPESAVKYFSEVLEKAKYPTIYFGLGMACSQSGDHARVLEIVTALRGMKQDELAQQLESTIRTYQMPDPGQLPPGLPPSHAGEDGRLIGSAPKPAPMTPSFSDDSGGERKVGTMRIRLKGKLDEERIIEEQQKMPQYRKHPGSL